jgi:hypothetical protein
MLQAVQALVISISSSVVYGHASSCTSPDEFLEAVEQSPEKQYCKVDAARSGSIGVVLDFSESSAVSSDWLQIAADLMSAGCGEANWALTFVEGEKVEVLSSDGEYFIPTKEIIRFCNSTVYPTIYEPLIRGGSF